MSEMATAEVKKTKHTRNKKSTKSRSQWTCFRNHIKMHQINDFIIF